MAQAAKVELRGIVPPLVTPFDAEENIDIAALRAEVRFHLEAGVHGICVTGSTGDGQMLSAEQSAAIARAAVEEVNGAVSVVAGIIRDSTAEVIRYGLTLKETGADALQVTPVHYLFQPDEQRTIEYYQRITEATGMPVIIYNVIPYALIPAATVYRILQEVDLVIGVKQSGGDIHQLADLLRAAPAGGAVLTAVDDLLYPAYLLGADGAVSAILTVMPRLCVEQWNAVEAGDHKTALDIHNKLLPVWRSIDGPNMTVRIKAALAMLGRNGGLGAHPLTPVSDAERADIRAALVEAGGLPRD